MFLLKMGRQTRLHLLILGVLIGAEVFHYKAEGAVPCLKCDSSSSSDCSSEWPFDRSTCLSETDYCFKEYNNGGYRRGCVDKFDLYKAKCTIEQDIPEHCFKGSSYDTTDSLTQCVKTKINGRADLRDSSASEREPYEKLNHTPEKLCYCEGHNCNKGYIPGYGPTTTTAGPTAPPPPPPPKVYGEVECYSCENGQNDCGGATCNGTYCYQIYQGPNHTYIGAIGDKSPKNDEEFGARSRRGCATTAFLECLANYTKGDKIVGCHGLYQVDFVAIQSCANNKSAVSYTEGQELSFNLNSSKLSKCVCRADHCNNDEIKPFQKCFYCDLETTYVKHQTRYDECHDYDEKKNIVYCPDSKYCSARTIHEGSASSWFVEKKTLRIKYGCVDGYDNEDAAFQCTEKNINDTEGHDFGCMGRKQVEQCAGNSKIGDHKPTKECICEGFLCNNKAGQLFGGMKQFVCIFSVLFGVLFLEEVCAFK